MDELITLIEQFITNYGVAYTIIAAISILALAVLKYTNCFSKLEENVRHVIYLAITVGASIIGAAVYMLCAGSGFDITLLVYMSGAIFAINQAWYSIISNIGLKDLAKKILDKISEYLASKK